MSSPFVDSKKKGAALCAAPIRLIIKLANEHYLFMIAKLYDPGVFPALSELMIAALESFAQSENESRSENIRLGLSKRAAIGTSGLYTRRLYGYCKDSDGSLKIDEEQAKVVRDIFRWYLDGASVLGIIKNLFDAGIPSPTGKEKWSKHGIEKMLANGKYTGTVTLLDSVTQDYVYQMKECISPIITESEFRAVQEERVKRSNVEVDEDGVVRRKSKKYSSKK